MAADNRNPGESVLTRYSAGTSILSAGLDDDPIENGRQSHASSDFSERHVEYILVASFDVDRGCIMEHQYPGPISGDEHMLAELMLPDQAHMRLQDWTVFFLHKDTSADDELKKERKRKRQLRNARWRKFGRGAKPIKAMDAASDEEDDDVTVDDDLDKNEVDENDSDENAEDDDDLNEGDESEGPPLIYVLNLVTTKHDSILKRGAMCKAMAICTKHSFLHIYKPLLLLALEEYFRNPVIDTLESLYIAVNSMDLSLMPTFNNLERQILQASEAKDMFIEKFSDMIEQKIADEDERASNSSRRSSNTSPRRRAKYLTPRDTHEFESKVLYNGIPVPIRIPVAITPETVGDFSLVKLISLFSAPSPQPFPVHPHLTSSGPNTHPVIVLVNALLTQKRVIFLGHKEPSESVAEAVLASCALVSGGILQGFSRHSFPYTDLTKIEDLLKVPGFIAGVTNPAFANKPEWWDVLCELPAGKITISSKIELPPASKESEAFFQQTSSLSKDISILMNGEARGSAISDPTGDTAFMESVVAAIANRQGEAVIRNKFRAWIQRFTNVAAAFEQVVYGASKLKITANEINDDVFQYKVTGHGLVWPDEVAKMREIAANAGRIEGWRLSRSYFSLVKELLRQCKQGELVRGIDLAYQIDRLRSLRVGDAASADIYLAICKAVERAGIDPSESDFQNPVEFDEYSPDDDVDQNKLFNRAVARHDLVNHLLCAMPESSGGLFYLSLGLFHKNSKVRLAVMGLLGRIMEHEAGRHFWASLSRFAKVQFFRIRQSLGDMHLQIPHG